MIPGYIQLLDDSDQYDMPLPSVPSYGICDTQHYGRDRSGLCGRYSYNNGIGFLVGWLFDGSSYPLDSLLTVLPGPLLLLVLKLAP